MASSPKVIVTAVGGGGVGEQLLKAVRLSEIPYRIVGTDITEDSKGLYEVDCPELVPRADAPAFADRLLELCDRHAPVALLCGSEAELRPLGERSADFAERGVILPVNPAEVLDLCLDKVRTCDFLAGQGFVVPRWRAISSTDELVDVDFLPAVLKPSVGGGGSANLFVAQTRDELRTLGAYLLGLYPEFIVQEYVGRPEHEYTVGVLNTMDGEFINSIALRRLLGSAISTRIRVPNKTGRDDLGTTLMVSSGFSHGELGRFPEVTEPCERIARALGATSAINIQCRLVDGEVVVFEINPRFSGTTSLRAMVGYNEPDRLIRHHVFGEPIEPRFEYRHATILRGLSETIACS